MASHKAELTDQAGERQGAHRRQPGPPAPGAGLALGLLRGGIPLPAGHLAQLQRTVGNQAVGQLVLQRAADSLPVVQRDDYPYGSANTTPHIHRYPNGAHLKILDGTKIRRLNLVQGGVRYRDNVAEAFSLARAAGNDTLVAAIKAVIAGIGPFGRPGSPQD